MYTEVPPTPEMKETIIKIMVEVLSILGIATKDIKQCRLSGLFLYEYVTVDRIMFRKVYEESYWKGRY